MRQRETQALNRVSAPTPAARLRRERRSLEIVLDNGVNIGYL